MTSSPGLRKSCLEPLSLTHYLPSVKTPSFPERETTLRLTLHEHRQWTSRAGQFLSLHLHFSPHYFLHSLFKAIFKRVKILTVFRVGGSPWESAGAGVGGGGVSRSGGGESENMPHWPCPIHQASAWSYIIHKGSVQIFWSHNWEP